jgi:hypothetical protein
MALEDPLFGTATQYAAEFEAELGYTPTWDAAGMSASAYALQLAIASATDGSQDAVREALLKLDTPSMYARLKFDDKGVIDQNGKDMPTMQVQNGMLHVVAPTSHAKVAMQYPRKEFANLFDDLKRDPSLVRSTAVTELSQVVEEWTKLSRKTIQEDYQVLFNSAESIGEACAYTPTCPWPVEEHPLGSHSPWPSAVNFDAVGVRLPPGADTEDEAFQKTMCLVGNNGPVQKQMVDNWKSLGSPTTHVGSQYYGDQSTGATPIFPGRQKCDYDPRFRPWYAAAVSGPKDIVLIIDISRSMIQKGRMDAAKQAVSKVLKTLIWADYATIVGFSDKLMIFGDGLLHQVNDSNREAMDEWAQELSPTGKTNYALAFEAAFDLILKSEDAKRSSRCNRIMLFMSDGDVTQGLQGSALLTKLTELNQEYGAKIFTYQFGMDVAEDTMKRIACQHEGIWWEVPDGGDLAGTMAAYYEYFAATTTVDRVKWTKYVQTHGKLGIAACLPVYDDTKFPTDLFGVTCVDMNMFQSIEDLMIRPDWGIFDNKMTADTLKCPLIDLAATDIQQLRKRSSQPTSPGKTAVCSACDMQAGGNCNSNAPSPSSGTSGEPSSQVSGSWSPIHLATNGYMFAVLYFSLVSC